MWGLRVQIAYTTVTKEHGSREQGRHASRSLFPLTATGAFLDMLYYRLNIVHLELAARAK
jgi:hypothetical protein